MIDNSKWLKVEDIETKHRLLYELMKKFHDICEKEGLVYNLYAGSLLGAVREKGIIPWDDDVDVSMPREDYNKFIEIVKKEYSDDVTVMSYPDENYIYPYAKFFDKNTVLYENTVNRKYYKISLYIDIFPIDGCPEDKAEIKKTRKYMGRMMRNRTLLSNAKIGISPCWWKKPYFIVRCFKKGFFSILGYKFFIKKEVKAAQRYTCEQSKYVANISMHGLKSYMLKEIYYNRKLYDFGPIKCWGPTDYDKNLSDLYGNYMQRPPKEQQVLKHTYDLYMKRV